MLSLLHPKGFLVIVGPSVFASVCLGAFTDNSQYVCTMTITRVLIYNCYGICYVYFRVDPIPYDTPKPAGHTRFVCISDTHSRTDGIQMPYGDILLHTGDFTELGLPSEVKKFNDWLGKE